MLRATTRVLLGVFAVAMLLAPCGSTAAGVAEASRPKPDAVLSSPDTDGQRELELATHYLQQAEFAEDDAGRRHNYELAKQHSERAVALVPDSADAHFVHFASAGRLAQMSGLGVASLKLMSLNAELDEVLRLDPDHANALAARGGMLVKLPRLLGGDAAKGVALLERAVTLDSTAIGKRLELSEAYHIVGEDEKARETAAQALTMAEARNDDKKIDLCHRFITDLSGSCRGCTLAAAGR
jgi:Tfp pilus assembly protein PilF